MTILLAIPALNEASTLPAVLAEGRRHISNILVVDDGSSDATPATAESAGAVVIRHGVNKGKGAALQSAFAYAQDLGYDWVFTLDGDGQHDPKDLDGFFPLLDRYDLVLGNRMTDTRDVPRLRLLGNQLSSGIVSWLCGCKVLDSQTGFRAYRVEMLRRLELEGTRFELESEVLVKAAREGWRIGHCPIRTIYGKEKSRFRNVRDSCRFVVMAIRMMPGRSAPRKR